MTASYQKTVIIGNVGREPEMRYTPSGVPVTSFTVAVNEAWTNAAGERQERTTWYRVTCWRKQAEFAAQYIQKGKLVLCEGTVEAQAYTDREGQARASLELTAAVVKNLSPKGDGERDGGDGGSADDDIPF